MQAYLCWLQFHKEFRSLSERIGAITVVEETANDAINAFSQHRQPSERFTPAHPLTAEKSSQRSRRCNTKALADSGLRRCGLDQSDASSLCPRNDRQQAVGTVLLTIKGMFSFSGLTQEQVLKLRADNHIYIVSSGRINVAGITPANIDPLCYLD